MRLTIIIPYYNTKEYSDELLRVLDPQISGNVEVIIIDDGSKEPYKTDYSWARVIRVKHGGQSKARNRGLKEAKGDYIQFVDSDDIVASDFIDKLLKAMDEEPELIEFSWRSLNHYGKQFDYRVKKPGDRLSNPSACTRCFKREFIGGMRFNENKDATEDEDFTRHLGIYTPSISVSIIPEYMYFYRTDVSSSNVKGYKQGFTRTKRITYYFKHVTADRSDILEAIKKDDEQNEVFLLTERNDIPELSKHCQILKPCRIWTHYLKGEPFNGCEIIPLPLYSKIILFIRNLHVIGGIETFIYQFGRLMGQKYTITLVVDEIPNEQLKRYMDVINVVEYDPKKEYVCDTLIMVRVLDKTPTNITFNQSVQMCHACRTNSAWHIPQNHDFIVNVSEVSKESFGEEAMNGIVIHNPISLENKKALVLVSATRIPAPDKGDNEKRMRQLAEMLEKADIPYLWFNFSEGAIPNAPKGFVNMGVRMDIMPYIKAADYLIQLSNSEAWSYSILEALTQNVPCIVCDFPSAREMGIEDGKNGYIVPFDMKFDVTKLLKVPRFKYEYNNEAIKDEWEKIIDKRRKSKKPKMVKIKATMDYHDTIFNRIVHTGEIISVTPERAKTIISANCGMEI